MIKLKSINLTFSSSKYMNISYSQNQKSKQKAYHLHLSDAENFLVLNNDCSSKINDSKREHSNF